MMELLDLLEVVIVIWLAGVMLARTLGCLLRGLVLGVGERETVTAQSAVLKGGCTK